MHHGFDWLHHDENDKCVISDVKSNYDIILSGHIHQDISAHEITPSSDTINLTGMAFFEGKILGETLNLEMKERVQFLIVYVPERKNANDSHYGIFGISRKK